MFGGANRIHSDTHKASAQRKPALENISTYQLHAHIPIKYVE